MPSIERFAVIGLGRFGSRLAANLASSGAEVIAIDHDRTIVEELRDQVTLAIALDATDEQALKIQGIDQVDCAIVCMGENFESNALTTALLKSLRVKRVIARARSSMQATILTRIGADAVVSPEEEAGDRWAHHLLTPYLIDHVELGSGYALAQLSTPAEWVGKTLNELELRARHNVTMVAIKRPAEEAPEDAPDRGPENLHTIVMPQPGSRLAEGDTLVLAGFDDAINKLPR